VSVVLQHMFVKAYTMFHEKAALTFSPYFDDHKFNCTKLIQSTRKLLLAVSMQQNYWCLFS